MDEKIVKWMTDGVRYGFKSGGVYAWVDGWMKWWMNGGDMVDVQVGGVGWLVGEYGVEETPRSINV